MVASYEDFAAEHRAGHLNPFNRWCAVLGNYVSVVGAVATLLGRWRTAAALVGFGTAVLGVGHLVEGNLPRVTYDLVRHPIWSVRADFAVAQQTIMRRPVHP